MYSQFGKRKQNYRKNAKTEFLVYFRNNKNDTSAIKWRNLDNCYILKDSYRNVYLEGKRPDILQIKKIYKGKNWNIF